MKLEKLKITTGLERPVKLLHVTDTHLTLVDGRDDRRKRALANRFNSPEILKFLNEQIAYAHAFVVQNSVHI